MVYSTGGTLALLIRNAIFYGLIIGAHNGFSPKNQQQNSFECKLSRQRLTLNLKLAHFLENLTQFQKMFFLTFASSKLDSTGNHQARNKSIKNPIFVNSFTAQEKHKSQDDGSLRQE